MVGSKARTLIFFILILFSSPWFLISVQNYPLILTQKRDTLFSQKQYYIDEINVLRGETITYQNGFLGKLLINKPTIFGQEMAQRYFYSFDPSYLFFKGGIDRVTSTGETGQFPLIVLPLILIFISQVWDLKTASKKLLLSIFLISPILSIYYNDQYSFQARLPFFLVVTYFSAIGISTLAAKRKIAALVLTLLLIFEAANIYHKFKNHYTDRLIEQLYPMQVK